MLSYFTDILDRPRQLLYLPNSWKRWATADREPIMQWTLGRITLLGVPHAPCCNTSRKAHAWRLKTRSRCLRQCAWRAETSPALPTSARVALWLARRALLGRALGTRASIVNVRNQRLHKGFTIPQLALFYGLKGGAISLFLVISQGWI